MKASRRLRLPALAVMTAVAAGLAAPSHAADDSNHFAVKGAGLASCSDYIEARRKNTPAFYQFGGWINGYLTALNQTSPETYDLAPWQSSDLLAGVILRNCRENPQQRFVNTVAAMVASLQAQRLLIKSPLVEAHAGETRIRIYRAVLRRTQEKLAESGLYDGESRTASSISEPKTACGLIRRRAGCPKPDCRIRPPSWRCSIRHRLCRPIRLCGHKKRRCPKATPFLFSWLSRALHICLET